MFSKMNSLLEVRSLSLFSSPFLGLGHRNIRSGLNIREPEIMPRPYLPAENSLKSVSAVRSACLHTRCQTMEQRRWGSQEKVAKGLKSTPQTDIVRNYVKVYQCHTVCHHVSQIVMCVTMSSSMLQRSSQVKRLHREKEKGTNIYPVPAACQELWCNSHQWPFAVGIINLNLPIKPETQKNPRNLSGSAVL